MTRPTDYAHMRDDAIRRHHERRSARSALLAIIILAVAGWLVLTLIGKLVIALGPWPLLIAATGCVAAAGAITWWRR